MKPLLLALFLFALPAFANEKPQYVYQDGVLQGFHHEQSGSGCVTASNTPGSVNTNTGNMHGTVDATTIGSSSCADGYNIVYTVESGGAVYILTPRGDQDPRNCGLLTRALIPHSVLADQPPQTPIKLRSDGRHFFVKIGSRESEYSVARAQ